MNYSFIKSTVILFLRGFGQIMLQQNAFTGAFFVIGIATNSMVMAVGAFLGSVVGVGVAMLLHYDRDELARGLYGFNGALVGIAVLFYYSPSVFSVALLVIGAILSSVTMKLMLGWGKLPPYTAPFVISTWLVLGIASFMGLFAAPSSVVEQQGGELGIGSKLHIGTALLLMKAIFG